MLETSRPADRRAEPAGLGDLRAIFAVGGLYTEGSGVVRIVAELANRLVAGGTAVQVYTSSCGRGEITRHLFEDGVPVHAERGRGPKRLGWSSALRARLLEDVAGASVVHNHSLWMMPNRYAAAAARRHGVPVVFTLHGFLEPWALARSRGRKRVMGMVFQNEDLHGAACLHVNSEQEIAGVRDYGLKNPIAVIPNGVPRRVLDRPGAPEEFLAAFPQVRGKRICLFLSRLHEKKGVLPLLEAWKTVRARFPEWSLVLAGPDDGLEAAARRRVADLGLEAEVVFTGSLYGTVKYAALDAASLFVLPTYSEGFSMAVLEAIGSALPVLYTPGCNFPEVADHGGGMLVEPEVDDIARGLTDLLARSAAELEAMGQKGRELARSRYTWDQVAAETRALYEWLQGGPRPAFVLT